jgi:3-phosphoshikimate 1-carboxyvinyltransferase
VTFEFGSLRGTVRVVGDKSISHRALMLAALAGGTSRIEGANRGSDVLATRDALMALGASIRDDGNAFVVEGGELHDPAHTIDARNSGTTARLLAGLCAGAGLSARIAGDPSLCRRPMERIARPLRAMGARVTTAGGCLPMEIVGPTRAPDGRTFALEMSSAQVKSAVLFAHLRATGPTTISGDRGSRDHTERLLRAFGREVAFDSAQTVLEPGALRATDVRVPGDLSAAAFFLVGASIGPESDLTIEGVGINPTRTGVLEVLHAMGADITLEKRGAYGEEPVADLRVRCVPLSGTTIRGDTVVRAIDELVVIAVAAAFARGRTEIRDAAELRTKESDRIAGIARLLRACGVEVEEFEDGVAIVGGHPVAPKHPIVTEGDHRFAMAAAALGAAVGAVAVDDPACAAVSFPEFADRWKAAQRPTANA